MMMTDAHKARPKVRSAEGRCYELAWRTLFSLPEPAGWLLVHGEVNGPSGSRVDHAWLERDGAIFDPVLNASMTWERYRRIYGASDGTRYTSDQAAHQLLEEGHYGPWGAGS
jgi:hypothetical protein